MEQKLKHKLGAERAIYPLVNYTLGEKEMYNSQVLFVDVLINKDSTANMARGVQ